MAEGPHRPVLGWLQETKEALAAVVAIVLALIAIVHWGGDVIDWARGKSDPPGPPGQGTLSVSFKNMKPGASVAVFTASGEARGVDGKRCILRWQTFDAGNVQPLTGPGQRGEQTIALDHHVCLVNRDFDIPAPSNVESLYAEAYVEDDAGTRLAPPARSNTRILAQPGG